MTERHDVSAVPAIFKSGKGAEFRRSYALELDDHLWIAHRSPALISAPPFLAAAGVVALFVAVILRYPLVEAGQWVRFCVQVAAITAVGVGIGFLLLNPLRNWLRRYYHKRLTGLRALGVDITSVVNSGGIHLSRPGQRESHDWQSLYTMEEDDRGFYFWITQLQAIVWPSRLFASEAERAEFRRAVETWAERSFVSPPVLARLGEAGRQRRLTEGDGV